MTAISLRKWCDGLGTYTVTVAVIGDGATGSGSAAWTVTAPAASAMLAASNASQVDQTTIGGSPSFSLQTGAVKAGV
jgi:hypothetical protein